MTLTERLRTTHTSLGHSLAFGLVTEAADEIERLVAELEAERIRLAACGVVALANTPDSAAKARDMLPQYRSASCDDVAHIVDSEMFLRRQVDALTAERDALAAQLHDQAEYDKGYAEGWRETLEALAVQAAEMRTALQEMVNYARADGCGLKIANDALSLDTTAAEAILRERDARTLEEARDELARHRDPLRGTWAESKLEHMAAAKRAGNPTQIDDDCIASEVARRAGKC